jgi:serine/threonine-protein kinase
MTELKQIGRYEIIEELGRGGMATVYLAYDPRFERQVAIKVLPRQFTHDPTFRARFEREARTIAQLEHSTIVPVYDFGEENEQPYIVMRYMTGGTLAGKLREGPLTISEVVAIFKRIASALDEAHSSGIVHRDLKPANIMFDKKGEAYLADFGIVKVAESTAAYTGSAIIGTPAYMSPEQARGESDIDGRSDVYTLGVIIFESLSGQMPYEAETPMGIAMKHILEPIPDILAVRRDLPNQVVLVISKAMAKNPDNRYPTANSLVMELEKLEEEFAEKPTMFPTGLDVPKQRKPPDSSDQLLPEQPIHTSPPSKQHPPSQPPPILPSSDQIPLSQREPSSGESYHIPESAAIPRRKRSWGIWVLIVGTVIVLGAVSLVIAGVGYSVIFGDKATQGATTTPLPILTPTPEITIDLLYSDDFSDPNSGWDRYSSEEGETEYHNEGYRLLIYKTDWIIWSNPGKNFTDVQIEVDAQKIGGVDDNMFGVICRYVDSDNFYAGVISSDGYYGILKRQMGSMLYFIHADNMLEDDAILQGNTSNHITLKCNGSLITLFVNDVNLVQVEDTEFASGDVGLLSGTFEIANTDILFDNFQVFGISP